VKLGKLQDGTAQSRFKEWPLLLLFFLMVLAYSLLCLIRHWRFESSGYDLGIQDQVIWHYSRFERPDGSIMGLPNMLGDHFDPLQMVLAPLYWISPHVETLLIAQAVLLMLPMFPIFAFTRKRLGRLPAYCFSLAYSIFWGIQYAAQFDFHDLSLGVPLAASAIYAMDENRRKWFWASVLLLPFVKEDMCLLVVFFGLTLLFTKWLRKNPGFSYGEGAALVGYGIFMFWLETHVLKLYFTGGKQIFTHWVYNGIGTGPLQALLTIILHPLRVAGIYFSDAKKIRTMAGMFAPFLFLPFCSPLSILAIPLISEKMLADQTNFWGFLYHYCAVLSPVLAMAAADGLSNLSRRMDRTPWGRAFRKGILPISAAVLLLNIAALPIHGALRNLWDPAYYRYSETNTVGSWALKMIPPDASVLAQDAIVPHLSHRQTIHSLGQDTMSKPPTDQFIITCRNLSPWPLEPPDIEAFLKASLKRGYQRIFDEQGWIVLEKSN
jgi:uncharacterized membrane protein